jgi:hypothetical protein
MTKIIRKVIRTCQNCKTDFIPSRDWQKFCSPECREAFWKQLRAEVRQEIIKRRDNHDIINKERI